MKSCLDCKYAEQAMLDNMKKCINEESVYYGHFVEKKDLCRLFIQKEE